LESYGACNGYVGEEAANDDEWVKRSVRDPQRRLADRPSRLKEKKAGRSAPRLLFVEESVPTKSTGTLAPSSRYLRRKIA
jgi:hypothetical protein